MAKKAKKPKKRATSDERRGTKPPSPAAVRQAAFDCEDLASAGERLGVADLDAVLKGSKRLSAAWDRGRLLRLVQDVASTTVVVPERADRLLGLPRDTFAGLYAKDRVVRELWDRGRYAINVEIERALVARVKEGDLKAVTAVEHLFGHRTEPAATDFSRLRPTEAEAATGILHNQLSRWAKESGLPRNADGSYSLPALIDWLRRWERDKVTGGREAQGLNPKQLEALREKRRQNDEAEGRLLERLPTVQSFLARAAWMKQLLSAAQAKEWSVAHEGHTAAQLEAEYSAAFHRVLAHWKDLPEELRVPEDAKALIEQGIELLMKDD